ncbi:hypothetical protein, partial [Escherichia coli]|uniref:hypothetical protein n=1 Tax=Escherichia coli TaxID=562 RepID=UPI001BDD478A
LKIVICQAMECPTNDAIPTFCTSRSANSTDASVWSSKVILDTVLFSLFFEGCISTGRIHP